MVQAIGMPSGISPPSWAGICMQADRAMSRLGMSFCCAHGLLHAEAFLKFLSLPVSWELLFILLPNETENMRMGSSGCFPRQRRGRAWAPALCLSFEAGGIEPRQAGPGDKQAGSQPE